jgi:hypothetical protein
MKPSTDLHWDSIHKQINERGYAHLPAVLSPVECEDLIRLYPEETIYRNVISMERYRFGKGEYKYFKYPLQPQITQLRTELYQPLAQLANHWMKALDIPVEYPFQHAEFIKQCHSAGQSQPTPLILKYEPGGYNTLHQDLYGEIYFPFQVVFVLTEPGRDHRGGELVFTEQLPRAQSRATVLNPRQGDAVIFTTNFRPVKGTKGYYRSKMKHGISEVTWGRRYALGVIFHDAA